MKDYPLGKGEVESSILSHSTRKPLMEQELDPYDRAMSERVSRRTAQERASWYDTELAKGCPEGWPEKFYAATAVYRYFDAAGELLYIGIANDLGRRNAQHYIGARWYPHALYVRVEWFPCREAAEWAECALIVKEAPMFNILRFAPDKKPPHFSRWFFDGARPEGRKAGWFRLDWPDQPEFRREIELVPSDAPPFPPIVGQVVNGTGMFPEAQKG